jgi:hypothetical protein
MGRSVGTANLIQLCSTVRINIFMETQQKGRSRSEHRRPVRKTK